MSQQRLLTYVERADFLVRHPMVATQVSETKSAIVIGIYDWDYNPAEQWKIPGIIAPWGMQVDDSVYGIVTIFPARNGEIYFSGFSEYLPAINNPEYVSPPAACRDGRASILGICPEDFQIPWMLIIGGVVVILIMKRKG
jgi:hypothetical protein